MKNILKTTIFAMMLISLVSCTNEKDPVPSVNGLKLRDVSEVTPPAILLLENASSVYIKLEWDKADYGVPTGAPGLTYVLEVSDHNNDPNFTHVVEYKGTGYASAPDRNCTIKVNEFNELLGQLPTFQCGQMNIDIRLKSTLGISDNAVIQYSNPITVAVTGYSVNKKILAFAKDSQSPANAPSVLSSSFDKVNDYQGYIYLEAGNYKLYQPDACGSFVTPIVYGGSGIGKTLAVDGSAITIAQSGHYLITADLTPGGLKYDAKLFRAFGVYGAGVKGSSFGSTNAVALEDVNNSNVWKVTMDLFKGQKIGFKSKNWTGDPVPMANPSAPYATILESNPTISFLGGGTTTDSLIDFFTNPSAANITVPGTATDVIKTQKYDITINVSNPRNYTYTLKLNSN